VKAKPSSSRGTPCLRRLARLSAYIERELPSPARETIRRHMARCADCRVVLRTLKKTIALCRQAPKIAPPRAVSKRVLEVLRRELARCRPPVS
jgi:anti-sigma factor RsiW